MKLAKKFRIFLFFAFFFNLLFSLGCSTYYPYRLYHIIEKNDLQAAKKYIKSKRQANLRGKAGETPLMDAVVFGHLEMCKFLIDKGANINARNRTGYSALSYAIEEGRLDIVKLLISKGASCNDKDKFLAKSALEKGHLDTCLFLIKNNVNNCIHNKKEILTGTLAKAIQNKNILLTKEAISIGADVNQNYKGKNMLIYAIETGSHEIVNLLFDKGLKLDLLNEKDFRGLTPLHYAVLNGFTNICSVLIQKGANINAKDNDGVTPLMISALNNDENTFKFLISKGASLLEKDKYNWSVYEWAGSSLKRYLESTYSFKLNPNFKKDLELLRKDDIYYAGFYLKRSTVETVEYVKVPYQYTVMETMCTMPEVPGCAPILVQKTITDYRLEKKIVYKEIPTFIYNKSSFSSDEIKGTLYLRFVKVLEETGRKSEANFWLKDVKF